MEERHNPIWAGLSVLGGFIVGIIALLAGLLAILQVYWQYSMISII
jgi:hypothetical protein